MRLGGLIAGALGGAANEAGAMAKDWMDDERKTAMAQKLAKIEEERQMRIMEAQEKIRQSGKEWDTDFATNNAERVAVADAKAKGAAAAISTAPGGAAKIEADFKTQAEIDRIQKTTPAQVAAAKQVKQAELDVQTADTIARGLNKDYLKASKQIANASRADPQWAPGTVAAAKLAEKVAAYRDVLANETDPAARKEIEQQIADLTGSSPTGKAFGDMTRVASEFGDLARNLEARLKTDLTMTDDERKALTAQAQSYRDRSTQILNSLLPGGQAPGAPANPSPSKLPKVGDVVNGYRYLGGNPNDEKSWAKADQSAAGKVR